MFVSEFEGEEERVDQHVHMHHMQLAQHFFPSCICVAALPIIHLLEDLEINNDGVAGRKLHHIYIEIDFSLEVINQKLAYSGTIPLGQQI